MKRTTIVADEELLLEIKQLAYEKQQSVSHVIQEAMQEYLKSRRRPKRGTISFLGIGRSGQADVSERAEEILASDLARDHGMTSGDSR